MILFWNCWSILMWLQNFDSSCFPWACNKSLHHLLVHTSWLHCFTYSRCICLIQTFTWWGLMPANVFASCVMQNPQFWVCLVHLGWLQYFTVVSCQTPWLWGFLCTPLVDASFCFMPCLIQTPPFAAWLVHPLWLQHFIFVLCQMQTSPCMAHLMHHSWWKWVTTLTLTLVQLNFIETFWLCT